MNQVEYLELLSKQYPSKEEVIKEIINLKAILNLPKGTEIFMSDIHGEADQFYHILNNCSGIIKEQIQLNLYYLNDNEVSELCFLIYYPKWKIAQMKEKTLDMKKWYRNQLDPLIILAKFLSVRYTRSKVRKLFPKAYSYILDELLHMQKSHDFNNKNYYESIIESLIEEDQCYSFLISICELIKRLAVAHLHIVGDIFDRGERPDKIMDMLIEYHSVDIQWGNHDILWMGAASLNPVCITGVIFNSLKYHNSQVLEIGYGISLRKLYNFAKKIYPDFNSHDAAMHTIAMLMFKLEGQLISQHPEYKMEYKLYLDKIKNGIIEINQTKYQLDKRLFSTLQQDPYCLSDLEEQIIQDLMYSFQNSKRLHQHVRFLYEHGSLYKIQNNNLIFHGCIPLELDGKFKTINLNGLDLKGKEYFDYLDQEIRKAYYTDDKNSIDLMWFLWIGHLSPLCGKNVKYFEHYYIEELKTLKEDVDHYYTIINDEKIVDMILNDFGIHTGTIINGHIPIKVIQGESPIRCHGKVIIIDGGFCKAYHEKTGISGYTLVYDSKGLSLRMHKGFDNLEVAIDKNVDMVSLKLNVSQSDHCIFVKDCDNGKVIIDKLAKLHCLLDAYRGGTIQCRQVTYFNDNQYERKMKIYY